MNLLYLIILFPLLSCLILIILFYYLPKKVSQYIGVSGIGISMMLSFLILNEFIKKQNNEKIEFFSQTLWNWISIHDFKVNVTLYLDRLSLTMLLMITIVGFLIQLYAVWYTKEENICHSQYFIYTNFFIFNMLLLVLADNLLVMYIGWEGVGFCSYVLIGFYKDNIKNCNAAIKTFIMTHIGDVLLIGSFLMIYHKFGTLSFNDLNRVMLETTNVDLSMLYWIALMILGGSISKSAQIPLHTWLIDAMVGPTPVSALIHAATMVTSGVYLISRIYNLFLMYPSILYLISIISIITLLSSGLAAITENNIKKILAYSTMSQIGYMFLALGTHASDAAIIHLVVHSLFKALLFLVSGSIIIFCCNRQNIFKMKCGLKKILPSIYYYFLIGSMSLSGFPIITAGFYSKDKIILGTLNNGNIILTIIALIGTFITSVYIFRVIFIIFYGRITLSKFYYCHNNISHNLPLFIFSIFSTFISIFAILPYVKTTTYSNSYFSEIIIMIISGLLTIIGVYFSSQIWLKKSKFIINRNSYGMVLKNTIVKFCSYFHTYKLDFIYNKIFVNSYFLITKLIDNDPFDKFVYFLKFLIKKLENILSLSTNGNLKWYIKSLIFGMSIFLLTIKVFL